MVLEWSACKHPISAALTDPIRAFITELQEELECEVKLDMDIGLKISATGTSVRETRLTCKAVPVRKNDWQRDRYCIIVPCAMLSNKIMRCRR